MRLSCADEMLLLNGCPGVIGLAVVLSGEQPDVGEKYGSLAVVREMTRSLTAVAFDAVYDRQTP